MQQNYETKYINGECSVAIQIVGVCRFLLANLLFSVEYLAKKKSKHLIMKEQVWSVPGYRDSKASERRIKGPTTRPYAFEYRKLYFQTYNLQPV